MVEKLDEFALLPLALVLVSGVLSFVIVGAIAQRFGQRLLDMPNERSSHTRPTPRGGGIGFVLAFAIATVVAGMAGLLQSFDAPLLTLAPVPLAGAQAGYLFLGLVLAPLAIVGLIDDLQGVSSRVRYLVQLLSAGIACAAFGAFPQPWLGAWGLVGQVGAIALSLLGFTALVNFYNFMDGLDGLVAGVTAVQLGFLAIYLQQPLLWLLVAALLGFLCWNWSPAKIFMGDSGSTVLGATVAIALLSIPNNEVGVAWSALAVTLPLTGDALYTLLCRLARGENIFQAHRSHLYQRLHQAGWPHAQVATVYIGFTGLVAIAIGVGNGVGAWLGLATTAISILSGEVYLRSRSPRSVSEL